MKEHWYEPSMMNLDQHTVGTSMTLVRVPSEWCLQMEQVSTRLYL